MLQQLLYSMDTLLSMVWQMAGYMLKLEESLQPSGLTPSPVPDLSCMSDG